MHNAPGNASAQIRWLTMHKQREESKWRHTIAADEAHIVAVRTVVIREIDGAWRPFVVRTPASAPSLYHLGSEI